MSLKHFGSQIYTKYDNQYAVGATHIGRIIILWPPIWSSRKSVHLLVTCIEHCCIGHMMNTCLQIATADTSSRKHRFGCWPGTIEVCTCSGGACLLNITLTSRVSERLAAQSTSSKALKMYVNGTANLPVKGDLSLLNSL